MYLQTLNSIACEHNSTIIFPMPITMLSGSSLFKGGRRSREQDECPIIPEEPEPAKP